MRWRCVDDDLCSSLAQSTSFTWAPTRSISAFSRTGSGSRIATSKYAELTNLNYFHPLSEPSHEPSLPSCCVSASFGTDSVEVAIPCRPEPAVTCSAACLAAESNCSQLLPLLPTRLQSWSCQWRVCRTGQLVQVLLTYNACSATVRRRRGCVDLRSRLDPNVQQFMCR